jgi:hypothetical protein
VGGLGRALECLVSLEGVYVGVTAGCPESPEGINEVGGVCDPAGEGVGVRSGLALGFRGVEGEGDGHVGANVGPGLDRWVSGEGVEDGMGGVRDVGDGRVKRAISFAVENVKSVEACGAWARGICAYVGVCVIGANCKTNTRV